MANAEGPWPLGLQCPGPRLAGIENELLFEPTTMLFFGDATDSLGELLNSVKSL